ncbi:MAG: sulfite oxidase, partial [Vicinamibacterales bacterium]
MPSRRDALTAAGRLGLAAAVSRLAPAPLLFAQAPAATYGKDHLIRHSTRPPDYETPVRLLDSFITPAEHFYTRSHMSIPSADPAAWTLTIGGLVDRPVALSLADLRGMPQATVTVTLECAGNGRAFFDPPVAGIQWARGAVGTARWTGVRMADLLARAGVRPAGAFVTMNGGDRPFGTQPDFVRQVPMAKAMHPDTLVALEMNGAPIPQVHGFPLRAIIPGWEGAYAVKWLTELSVLDREFDGFWVQTAYRYPKRQVAPGTAVPADGMTALAGLAVKSLITRPLDGAAFAPGPVDVAGYAWAGEADIARDDNSVDNGATRRPARLTGEQAKYTWRRFEYEFVAREAQSYLVMARATDSTGA